jgi:integrase
MADKHSTTGVRLRRPNPKLTEPGIKALKPRSSVYRIRDGLEDSELKGFGVCVAPSGTRSFFLSFTSPETGKRTQGTIGTHPGMRLTEARSRARQWRRKVREGIDPVLELKREDEAKRKARQAEQAEERAELELGTMDDLFRIYTADMELDGKRSTEYARSIYRRDIAPSIGSKKARDVTTDDCADIIATIAERGALHLANRVRSFLIASFNFGSRARSMPRWRRKAPEFGLTTNPARATVKALPREPRGQRHLSSTEVRAVWEALSTPHTVTAGHGARWPAKVDVFTEYALKLLFATGQRVEEVLGASRDEFDFEQMLWLIPAGRRKNAAKNLSAEPHAVPLTAFHLRLLEELEPYSEGSPLLFPAKDGPRGNHTLAQATRRLCPRLGMQPFTPRDIRRTWKTLAGSIGIDLEIRNRIQGHAFDDIGSQSYDRYSYLPEKRRAMDRWTTALETWLSAEDNVIPLTRGA